MNTDKKCADFAERREAMEKAEIYRNGMSRDEARKRLRALVEGAGNRTALRNDSTGEEVSLTNKSIGKLTSDPAALKSERNGFTKEQHYAEAADIYNLFKYAIKLLVRPDRAGNPNVIIHRFGVPLYFGDAVAFLTVKESRQHGKKMYSIELMEIGKINDVIEQDRKITKRPGGALEEAGETPLHTSPAPGLGTGGLTPPCLYIDNIRHLFEKVNSKR